MIVPPRSPCRLHGRQTLKLNTLERTDNADAEDMAPLRVRLRILHHHAVSPQRSRDQKCQGHRVTLADVDHARVAKGSPGGRDGGARDRVVDDFVRIELP